MKSSIFIGLLYGALLAATTTYKAMMTTLFIGRQLNEIPSKEISAQNFQDRKP
jgi:hypothetical protein